MWGYVMKKVILGFLFMLSALGFSQKAVSGDFARSTAKFIYRYRRPIAGAAIVAAIWWLSCGDDDEESHRNVYTERSATLEKREDRCRRLREIEQKLENNYKKTQRALAIHRANSPTKKFQKVKVSPRGETFIAFITIKEESTGTSDSE